ncbi:MAG TPA: hypothetical protein VGM05_12985 [Planctomycetaceae bacterium]|jgi:hypothetical protein
MLQVPAPEANTAARRIPTGDSSQFVAALFPPQAEPPAESDGKRSPAAELKRSREQLLKVKSLSAKVTEKVEVLEKSFKAEGRYLQMGLQENDWKMRLELSVKIGGASGSLLEICDGELLWMRSDIDTGRRKDRREGAKKDPRDTWITRRNVTKILNAAKKLPDKSYETGLITSLGLGGLPALIASLEQNMKFNSVKDVTLHDKPMIVVEGAWIESIAQKLRGSAAPGQPAPTLLPPSAPDSVRIYIDHATGFPHRIMYLKKIAGRDVQKPMLVLDFLDVEINPPISDSEFDYVPPKDITPTELTQGFLDQLTPQGNQAPPAAPQPAGPPVR